MLFQSFIFVFLHFFHNRYLYLRIDDTESDALSPVFFEESSRKHNMPLQVMIPSDSKRIVPLLLKAGFQMKRTCYEMSVGPSDLMSALSKNSPPLLISQKGSPAFAACASLPYCYYQDTHALVNPMTASLNEFSRSFRQLCFI